jgi:inner membrane protein
LDNLTHTLTAVALSHAGLNRKTRFATLTLILAANVPDVDCVSRLWGSATYLKYHRGITHSLLGVTVLALLLAWIVSFLGRKARPKPAPLPNQRWLFSVAWIGTASHLLMDFTNSYGVRPFLPFSGRWYAWDIMFIFDPLLLALLASGLGLPAILRLVSEEVGAKQTSLRRGAAFCLCALVALWGVRDLAHRRVLSLLDAHTYQDENPLSIGAFPSMANPFEWTGVVETESAYHVLGASALASDVDLRHDRIFRKPEPSPELSAAMETRTGRIFMDFARFPWAESAQTDDGYEVSIRDLRFFSTFAQRRGFVVDISLDKSLLVVAQQFSFSAPEQGMFR